jgi:tRNA(Ser,Leu) C12 N-acetylase TAN1
MKDWNLVVNVGEHGYSKAKHLLAELGAVSKTDFYNVLVMRVDDPMAVLDTLSSRARQDPGFDHLITRVLPVTACFDFQTPEEFENKARDAVQQWLDALAGASFHVRMHRRGFKGRLASPEEERFLDHYLMEQLAARATPARISFDDPDVIIAVDTVNQRAGLSLWRRADLEHYPLLKLD